VEEKRDWPRGQGRKAKEGLVLKFRVKIFSENAGFCVCPENQNSARKGIYSITLCKKENNLFY
jgi:hypothetical protein